MSFSITSPLTPWPEDLGFQLTDELNQNDKGSTSSFLTDEPSALQTSTESKTSSSFALAHPPSNAPCKRGAKRKSVPTSQIPKRLMLNNKVSSGTELTKFKDNFSSMFLKFEQQLVAGNLEALEKHKTFQNEKLELENNFKLKTIHELSKLPKTITEGSDCLSFEQMQSLPTELLRVVLLEREIRESAKLLRRLSS